MDYNSWFFISLMAFLLVAMVIIGPLVVILIVIKAASKKSDREAQRGRDDD